MSAENRKIISEMLSAGMSLSVNIRSIYGSKTAWIDDVDMALKYLADKEKFEAAYHCVEVEVLREWLARRGYVQCAATTKSGKRCNNNLSGVAYDNPLSWLMAHGDVCVIHGGVDSKGS